MPGPRPSSSPATSASAGDAPSSGAPATLTGVSLEDDVRALIRTGRDRGAQEYEAIRAKVDAGKDAEPSGGPYGLREDIANFSDLARVRGYLEGLEDAVLCLARALDAKTEGSQSADSPPMPGAP